MTNEEARKYILANWFDGDDSSKYCTDGCEEVMAMKKADEALEKQVPMNVTDTYRRRGFIIEGRCSCCGQPVLPWHEYCNQCGQKLDWSNYDK